MKNALKKATALLIGLLAILLLLEIILRLVGYVNQSKASSNIESDGKAQYDYTILCAGDSFTRGIAAPDGKDYPSRLDELLNSKTDKTFRVVNTSVAGKNTSQILNTLQTELDALQPDVIILLLGGANNWNYWGYNQSSGLGGESALGDLLYNIRVYKLINLIFRNIKDKSAELNNADNHIEKERYEKAIAAFNEANKNNPRDGKAFYNMGAFYMYERNVSKAIKWFQKGMDSDPAEADNYIGMGIAYQELGQNDKRTEYFKLGISKSMDKDNLYVLTIAACMKDKHIDEAIDMLKEGIEYNPRCRNLYTMLKAIRRYDQGYRTEEVEAMINRSPPDDSLISPKFGDIGFSVPKSINTHLKEDKKLVVGWIKSDIKKIISLCRERGVKIILQNYPLRGHSWNSFSLSYKQANTVLEEIANEYSLCFINNKQIFDRLGDIKKEFLEPKGSAEHCNAKGYWLMAKNCYDKIIEIKLAARKENSVGKKISKTDSNASLSDFNKAIELDSNNAVVYIDRGAAKAQLGKLKEAISDFNKAIALDSNNVAAYSKRGHARMDIGRFQQALTDYDKAIALSSKDIEAYNNRGYLKSKMKNYKGAIADYDKTLKLDPGHAFAYNNRGYAKLQLKRFKEALQDIDKSIKLVKNNSYAYKNRALIYIALNKLPEACKDLQNALDHGFADDYGIEVEKLINKYCK